MTDLESRLLQDKEQMYASNKELQAENDYLRLLIKDIKDVLCLDEDVDGYEIVVALEKEFK